MFERFTEKAKRSIFFGRYEASWLASGYIETEHLLLGLLREDKALASELLRSFTTLEQIRKRIEEHAAPSAKIPTSVDLPLTRESKRVLSYAAEESERMKHGHIGTAHLLVGLLREEGCFAAQLLRGEGLTLDSAREWVRQSEMPPDKNQPAPIARIERWLTERRDDSAGWIFERKRLGNRTGRFDIYAAAQRKENEEGRESSPAERLADIQKRLASIAQRMESAIANHEFEKARFYSEEERKERENLRLLRQEFNLEEAPPRVPLLCIEVIGDQAFSEVQERCDNYMAKGVEQVWLLDSNLKRAYTVTQSNGLREFHGAILTIANPRLEMDLGKIFD